MNTQRKLGLMGVAVAAALLGACSGDDGNDTPPVTSAVPASAGQSSQGFIQYLQALVVADADLLEPVDVGGFTAPTQAVTETEEPITL
jgi:hypothetical protein